MFHVNLEMSSQVRLVRESLGAVVMRTRIGFLSSVDSDVVGEEPGSGECLLTNIALVVPGVSLHVHGQGWHAGVELVTNIAVSSLVSVDLSVSCQVTSGCKLFTTISATLHLARHRSIQTVAGVL